MGIVRELKCIYTEMELNLRIDVKNSDLGRYLVLPSFLKPVKIAMIMSRRDSGPLVYLFYQENYQEILSVTDKSFDSIRNSSLP